MSKVRINQNIFEKISNKGKEYGYGKIQSASLRYRKRQPFRSWRSSRIHPFGNQQDDGVSRRGSRLVLLNRSRNGAVPTEECRRLLPSIRQIVGAEKQCREQISEILGMENGHVSVGSSYTEYYKWLTHIISQFGKAYPNITISISEGTSSELIDMVEEGKIDFCIVSKRKGSFGWIPIKEDDLLVWVPKDNPYVKQGYMPLKALEKEPFIEMYPDKETDNSIFLKENDIKVRAKYSTTDSFAAYFMVRAGLGITLVN